MKGTLFITGGLVATLALCTAALAAQPHVISAEPGAAAALVRTTMPRQVSAEVAGVDEIVSTFNSDPNNAYDPTMGSGVGMIIGMPQYIAVPFTPDKNYTVTTITFAMSHTFGGNGVIMSLNADDNGKPGAEIRTATFTDFTTWDPWTGACCQTASFRDIAAPVTAGTQYWIVAKTGGANPDAVMVWHFNNIGAIRPYAYMWGSDQWEIDDISLLPAFSVQGTPAP